MRVTVRLNESLARELHRVAKQRGASLSVIAREAISRFLESERENNEDLLAFQHRATEPTQSLDTLASELGRRGLL